MGIPQLRSEGNDTGGTTAGFTVDFTSGGLLTWQAGDILEIAMATDGYVPTLATANGFVLAQDPVGNTASVTTNGGAAGTADCGMFVFWKRATGSNTTSDPPPVFAAATNGGTCWCLEPNAYSGARTTGTPYHIITTAILGTASATVAPPSVTPTLANSLVMTRVASSNDDQAFNNWTMTGSSGPAAGSPASGWHNGSGNACAFTGGDGGYASVGGARSGTTTFAASTKQAQITLVMASLAEAGGAALDDPGVQPVPPVAQRLAQSSLNLDDDLPGTAPSGVPEDIGPAAQLIAVASIPAALAQPSAEETPSAAAPAFVDDSAAVAPTLVAIAPQPTISPLADELPGSAPTAALDDVQPFSRLDVQPLAAPLTLPAAEDLPVAVLTAAVSGAGGIQRSNDAPPGTGTLTTGTIPAWATSTAYVLDSSGSGVSRVQNGGNVYQCSADGTSASSGGGPTGIGTAISDGSTTWYFVGPVFATNTVAGSQVLAVVMRGTQSATPGGAITPTDNDSGSFTLIVNTAYAGFPGSFAGVWRRSAAANAKTGYAVSGQFGSVGSGQGDEMTVGWLALQGVVVGAPHAFSQVERASPTSGSVTAANITTTVRTLVVSYWLGNGNVQTVGTTDTAAPAGGLTLVANVSFPLSIAPPGYIQIMVGSRIADPGTFAETWTAVTNEGAQLVTVAFEIPAGVFEDMATLPVLTWARPPAIDLRATDDELPVVASAAIDEDQPVALALAAVPALLRAVATDDELPTQGVLDEGSVIAPVTSGPAAPLAWQSSGEESPAQPAAVVDDDAAQVAVTASTPAAQRAPGSDDELPVATALTVLDEDSQIAAATSAAPLPISPPIAGEDMPAAAAVALIDEDPALPIALPLLAQAAPALPSDDMLPVAAVTIVDDDVAMPAPLAPLLGVWLSSQPAVDELPVALALEDAAWTFAVSWAPERLSALTQSADEMPAASPPIEDIGAMTAPLAAITWSMRAWSADDEIVPFVAPAPIVDEDSPRAPDMPALPGLPWIVLWGDELAQILVPTTPTDGDEVTIIITNTEVAVKLLESTFRQNSTHRPLQGIAFNAVTKIDFPTEFPGGGTFKMVSGATVITGPVTGDALGVWSYAWQAGDLATPGVYAGTVTWLDGAGKPETFPTSTDMEITVLATL